MAHEKNHQSIAAVIAAYNEADRIAPVLQTIVDSNLFDEVVVVDDGSTDATGKIIQTFPVHYLRNATNQGKGAAMNRGVSCTRSDIIFFCDADITGLNKAIINDIIQPVRTGTCALFIAMRNRKLYFVHHVTALVPLLGGERAITRNLWELIPNQYKQRFKIEVAMNFYALYYDAGYKYKVFRELKQVIKEKKYGWRIGLRHRWGMMLNVCLTQLQLHYKHIPSSHKNSRRLAIVALQSLFSIGLALILFVAAYYGPMNFARVLTANELREDPSAPIAMTVLYLAEITTKSTAIIIGLLLLIPNALLFFFTFKKLTYWLQGLIYKMKSDQSDEHSH